MPGKRQGRAGRGLEQLGLVQDVPAHDRGLELGLFKVPSKSNCPAIL